MCIAYSVWTVSQQPCCHHFQPNLWWYILSGFVLISVFTICYKPRLLFRGSFCIWELVVLCICIWAWNWRLLECVAVSSGWKDSFLLTIYSNTFETSWFFLLTERIFPKHSNLQLLSFGNFTCLYTGERNISL